MTGQPSSPCQRQPTAAWARVKPWWPTWSGPGIRPGSSTSSVTQHHDGVPDRDAVLAPPWSAVHSFLMTERASLTRTPPAVHLPFIYDQDRKSTRLNSSHANISYAV